MNERADTANRAGRDAPLPHGPLGASEVHLWIVDVDEAITHRSEGQILVALSDEDREQVDRARVPHVRRERLVSRALLQLGLCHYLERRPGEWRISRGRLGRPDLVAQEGQPDLRFNLSHSGGLVVCGFTIGRAIGVDVESRERKLPVEDFARYLSPFERSRWKASPAAERNDLFLRYWTLKEAYAKALGLGVSMGFDRISIELSGSRPKLRAHDTDRTRATGAIRPDALESDRLASPPGATEPPSPVRELDPERWHLQQWTLPPAHYLALAVASPSEAPVQCRLMRILDVLHAPV
jgi:4'-phosphopantetheinyl transferase